MPRSKANRHVGSDFKDFLAEETRLEQSTAHALKRVLVWQLEQGMKETGVSPAEFAHRTMMSSAAIHRLLDISDSSVTLATISKAAAAVGRSMRLQLAD